MLGWSHSQHTRPQLHSTAGILLLDVPTLEAQAQQVHSMLAPARDRDALLTALPMLFDPRTLASVLVTVEKCEWDGAICEEEAAALAPAA